ncbi:MAG: chemotaxis protein CheA, partial [Pseudomonadota bacterium]
AVPDETATREVVVNVVPGPDFRTSGHDLLQLVRAARPLGLVETSVEGAVSPLDAFDPDAWTLSWTLRFSTGAEPAAFENLIEFYAMSAEIDIADPLTQDGEPDQPQGAPQKVADTPVNTAQETAKDVPQAPDPAPSSASAPPPKPTEGNPSAPSKSLRVDLNRIDRLVQLVGERLITQAGLAQSFSDVEDNELSEVAQSVDVLSRQLRELQESVMAIRAQPVKSVFSRMPRVVRDLSDKLEKRARLVLSGEHTEVDTTVIEELSEPLMHMLRNSMDHGLEDQDTRIAAGKDPVGTIELKAEHRGERVIISLSDDGQGIDRDRVLDKAILNGLVSEDDTLSPEEIDQLIFHPGFSTAQSISSVSGRGVGMDVVKKKLQALGGRCALNNRPGKGAEFLITLPLTLAVMDGMTIKSAGQQFILPLSSVVEAVKLDHCQVRQLPDRSRLLERRGDYLRMLNLGEVLSLEEGSTSPDMAIVVDTEVDGLIALQVDDLVGQRQIVLKSLEANYHQVEGVSGATILGDGHVALILDIPALLHMGKQDYTPKEVLH